jgi:hypothetical protein
MFKTIYRVKEINKNGKTTYMVQEKFFLFWWNMLDEALDNRNLADNLCTLLEIAKRRKLI